MKKLDDMTREELKEYLDSKMKEFLTNGGKITKLKKSNKGKFRKITK